MKLCIVLLTCLSAICIPAASIAQYILNGDATKESCNCYSLTKDNQWEGGSVWQSNKIDLNEPFDFNFNVYLGCKDADGADGIVFILQPLSTSLGAEGGGLGFLGVSPSIGIALDTWQNIEQNENHNDPNFDHISIQANGIITHGNDLAGPVQASASSVNIEDCQWHVIRIKWDPANHTLSTWFDGVFRLSAQKDLVKDIFNNDPMVYWGFSASTGGESNIQKFCTSLNPDFATGLTNNGVCLGTPVSFKDSSTSFTSVKSHLWDFGDGTTSVLANPPPHLYTQPGEYVVKHTITAMDNCVSEPFTRTIRIGDKPVASLEVSDTCQSSLLRLALNAGAQVGTINEWKWELDGAPFSDKQFPDFTNLPTGNHSLAVTVKSDIGCVADAASDNFNILPVPGISLDLMNGCVDAPVLFAPELTDNLTTVSSWKWSFGDGVSSNNKNNSHAYTNPGNYPVTLQATATNGCITTLNKNVFINELVADAGNDTLVIPNTPFQLNGSGGSIYEWIPATGLNDNQIANPTGEAIDDITYHLTVKSAEGCTDTASVHITVFKGSAVYVPNAFTPNNDGLNDVIRPTLIGIKKLHYFTIFDRWGHKVFTTNEMGIGWDGAIKNGDIVAGTYSWMLLAMDVVGKIYKLQGAVVLIK